jgi:hypothetical protein
MNKVDIQVPTGSVRPGDAVTDTLLAAASRTDIVATRIDPALSAHQDQVVIEDRGIHTMQSYALASLLRSATSAHPRPNNGLTCSGSTRHTPSSHTAIRN